MIPTKWKCNECHAVLGFVTGNSVRIKRKDLYVEIKRGDITTNCTLCGKRQTLPYDDPTSKRVSLKEGR